MEQNIKERILKANLEVHKLEAPLYDSIHYEIFNPTEQERLNAALRDAAARIPGDNRRALDIGCGTGNITLKLMGLGFTVDALDLSSEMLEVLRIKAAGLETGALRIHCGTLEDLALPGGYGLIVLYSVLHHLPDYLRTISRALDLLAPGGILLIDHEHVTPAEENPALRSAQRALSYVDQAIRLPYLVYRKVLKIFLPAAYLRLRPNMDYTLSDYWGHGDRALDTGAIEELAASKGCSFGRSTYLNYSGRWSAAVLHPLFRSSAADTQRIVIQKPLS